MHHCFHSTAFVAMLLLCSCDNSAKFAQPGDHVQVDFTCRLADGSLVETTRAQVAGDETAAKSTIFATRDTYRPFRFQVAEKPDGLAFQPFDPLEQKIAILVARQIGRVPLGRTTSMPLPSTQIEHYPAKDRFVAMAMHFTLPRTRELPVQEFEVLYGAAPREIGAEVGKGTDNPGVVRAINDQEITVYYSSPKKSRIDFAWGSGFIQEQDAENFEVTMDVQPGQLVQRVGGLPGRIASVDKDTFTIDFAQLFAGETLHCEVMAQKIDPEQKAERPAMAWVEDYDQGLRLARQQGKPMVLFLYAKECPYCREMEHKTFPDPALDPIRGRFVWVKIDSKQREQYADKFGQQGYPLTLVLNGVGGEIERFSGRQHIATLAYRLDRILAKGGKG